MLSKPIFETLPIAITAASILFMLVLHSVSSFLVGSALVLAACIMLYRRLSEMGTDPAVMDYTERVDHTS
jgi:hypothetical protein